MNEHELNDEEQDLLEAFEGDDFASQLTAKRKQQLEAVAENTVKKDRRINIRISGRDLQAIQRRALEEGMPYQTLVSSILHKYVSGSLQDVLPEKSKKKRA